MILSSGFLLRNGVSVASARSAVLNHRLQSLSKSLIRLSFRRAPGGSAVLPTRLLVAFQSRRWERVAGPRPAADVTIFNLMCAVDLAPRDVDWRLGRRECRSAAFARRTRKPGGCGAGSTPGLKAAQPLRVVQTRARRLQCIRAQAHKAQKPERRRRLSESMTIQRPYPVTVNDTALPA